MYRELDSKNRKQFRVWLSDEERKLLDAKAEQYGYAHLSDYVRDAAIYESLMQINISYTDEVNKLFQEYINETRKLTKEIRRILKYDTSASPQEREMIQQALYRVYSQTKSLKKSVNDNISIEKIIKQSREKQYNEQAEKLY